MAALTPEDLVEIEAIKAVKYRYIRAVDLRDWDLLATTFTEDACARYSAGKLSFDGREAIIGFLRASMPPREMLSAHRVHHPEIELTGPDTATARWALDDVVIFAASNLMIRGAAYYEDELVKLDGEWRIRRTGYRRLYEESLQRDGITLTDDWWAEGVTP
ncbi:MAG TPA: nuclear transport factor 2 family protein [Acidimicrobiales bacterium]|nr:nuclear transport factor 2 family protein [Acidimicrobiales bacterium]